MHGSMQGQLNYFPNIFVKFLKLNTMKKLKILLLACIAFSGLNSPKVFGQNRIKIHTEFGNTRDCRGFGFCIVIRIPMPDQKNNGLTQSLDDKSFNGTVMLGSSGELEFEIDKETGITAEGYKKYLSSGLFIFEEDFQMPKDVLEKIGYKDEFIIRSGKYEIKDEREVIKLIIVG